jgi:transcriptional regulator with XRE-family HTH domain
LANQRSKDNAQRRELASFLRKKREQLPPPRAASPHQRRLTPGLRREEVAELAGVGTTWYTWLEQARDIRPSERALRHIARALQLGKLETKYLLELALERAPRSASEESVPRAMLALVNGLNMPALVLGRSGTVLAYNLAANALCDIDYWDERNYIRRLFTPEMRAFIVNWHDFVRHEVAVLRNRTASVLGDPAVAGLVEDLTRRSPEFRELWTEQAISDALSHRYVCNHPFVGRLEFEKTCISILEHPELFIAAAVVEEAETRQRLTELIGQRERGEHDAANNLWTALHSQLSARQDSYSDHQ